MIDELHAERVPREEALDLHEEMHRLAQALLKAQPVVLRGRGRRCRVRYAVHAVLRMRVHRRHRRMLGV